MQNVTEVCDGCSVVVSHAAAFSCSEYCHRQGLHCVAAQTVKDKEDESRCDTADAHVECDRPFAHESHSICECSGYNMARRVRQPVNHELVAQCLSFLDKYEECLMDKPHLSMHHPDPMIRARLERDQRAQCVNIPPDLFEKHNVVGCGK